ncbi:hypothetical protein YTPLAS21_19190 [Candidatus Nitrosocosmicus sp.]|nr:hypothetical protein YTPLAS21_19190 [Candidatus Nitrosocosmicus sp.]
MIIDHDREEIRAKLLGSFLEFEKTMFPLVTGKSFLISQPIGRESHHISVARALTRAFNLEIPSHRLVIAIPPGHGKSVMLCMFIAWALAHYPDARFLYVSYSADLAASHTAFIKSIIMSEHYQWLFEPRIKMDSRANDDFKTIQGGRVTAVGSTGTITGKDCGLPNLDRFSGCMVIDDPIKPDDALSARMRERVIRNYEETLMSRARSALVPYILIAQRLHMDDLSNYLIEGNDGYEWEQVILPSLDLADNALYPEVFPKETLYKIKEYQRYVWAAQHMQSPVPDGGGLYLKSDFPILDHAPDILASFITVDSAESTQNYADYTVFSFWGVYEIVEYGVKTGMLGLHWLDCVQLRCEPKDLQENFMGFWLDCLRFPVKPKFAAIEKKSTGVTLVSVLKEIRGIQIRPINRTAASKSKFQRFIDIQQYVARKQVSFTKNARHLDMCLEHLANITANGVHRFDDITDTLVDACQLALMTNSVYSLQSNENNRASSSDLLAQGLKNQRIAQQKAYVTNISKAFGRN